MIVPLKWLKDYVDIDISNEELADRLTLAGLEVSDIKVIGGSWDKVVVGKILEINPTPTPTACAWPPSIWAKASRPSSAALPTWWSATR